MFLWAGDQMLYYGSEIFLKKSTEKQIGLEKHLHGQVCTCKTFPDQISRSDITVIYKYRYMGRMAHCENVLKSAHGVMTLKHVPMMTSSNGNIFRVTGPLCGEFTGHRWHGAFMFSLICVWINGWENNHEAGNLGRYRAHYDVTVMPHIPLKVESIGHQRTPLENGIKFELWCFLCC